MHGPIEPGARRGTRAPLPTAALIVGIFFSLLGIFAGAFRSLSCDLASDALVVRALGASIEVACVMLLRAAIYGATGLRRVGGLVVSTPGMLLGAALIVSPSLARVPYDHGADLLVAWVVAAPGLAALALSRWQVR